MTDDDFMFGLLGGRSPRLSGVDPALRNGRPKQ